MPTQRETPMINHVSIGVRDLARTKRFYDSVLQPLGYDCLSESAGSLGYGRDAAPFSTLATQRPRAADENSGLPVCLTAPTRRSGDPFHSPAAQPGRPRTVRPGPRPHHGPAFR